MASSSTISLQPACLLHYKPFRDTSLIVDALTLEHGRVSLIARGARSARPNVRALYQPFRTLLISWLPRDGLQVLTGIEEQGPATPLEGTPLACAYYLNEILMRLLERHQPMPALLGHYLLALEHLSAADDNHCAPILRQFEVRLLDALGLLPDFSIDVEGRAIGAGLRYRFDVQQGQAVPLQATTRDSAQHETTPNRSGSDSSGDQHLAIPKRIQYPRDADKPALDAPHAAPGQATSIELGGRALLALAGGDIGDMRASEDADSAREVGALLRRLMRLHLGDAPLHSRELLLAQKPDTAQQNPAEQQRGDEP